MTRLFLAAGVAALAIAAPASAGPGGGHGHGGGGGGQAQVPHGGGGGGRGGQHAFAAPRGGGGGHAFAAPRGGGGHAFAAPRMQRQAFAAHAQRQQRVAIERPQRMQRQQAQARFVQRQQAHGNRQQAQARMAERQQVHGNRQQAQQRMAQRQQMQGNRQQAQQRMAQRQQMQANQQARARFAQRQQALANRQQAQNIRGQQMRFDNRMAARQALQANRMARLQEQAVAGEQLRAGQLAAVNNGRGFGVGGCPPGLANKGCMPPGLAAKAFAPMSVNDRVAAIRTLGDARFAPVEFAPQRQILDPFVADALIGVPLGTASTFAAFEPIPAGLSYLYPPTPAYYYEYGNGYAYQINRSNNLIDALIPLLAGGILPGSYLPAAYMSSYVPDYYGFNSFYPASYSSDYGYSNLCNRYAYGVVYQVDCYTGLVQNVVPLYAGGYGVGQILPSSYAYYNVPTQYRGLYYDTADYNYWYAPGAIYQYDPRSSLITSVAALLSPGFTVGQPLPVGYGVYNVPYAYRATYYDTPNAWYRYNNGYIYQVNPATQLVTAVVASLLT